jgi:hypothetical protein
VKVFALIATFFAGPGGAPPMPLHLICQGIAETLAGSSATAYAQQSNGQWGTATVNEQHMAEHPEQLKLDFDGAGGGEVLFPMTMMPPIHGGKNGALPLREVEFSEGGIIARTTINVFNKPRIVVDRVTGNVTVTGFKLAFQGHCVPYDPQTVQRAF